MITTLVLGMLITAAAIGLLWGGFKMLQKRPAFSQALNTRNANKRMLQLTLLVYFIGIVATVTVMAI